MRRFRHKIVMTRTALLVDIALELRTRRATRLGLR